MLAHLQHLYLSALLEHLNVRHVLFFHLLYRYLFISKFMGCQLHKPELTFTQCFFQIVEVKYITVAHCSHQSFFPLKPVVLRIEVEDARLVGRDHHFQRVVLNVVFFVATICQIVCYLLQVGA